MFTANDLPDTISLFPLPGALMLPRANLPLHIFEPRYLAMFEDALKTPHRLIGMIQPVEVPGRSEKGLHDIGCAGRVTAFSETEDGRYMITLTGISRFRIVTEESGFTPYRRARVKWTGFEADLGKAETDPDFERDGFFDLLGRYFNEMGLSTDWEWRSTSWSGRPPMRTAARRRPGSRSWSSTYALSSRCCCSSW